MKEYHLIVGNKIENLKEIEKWVKDLQVKHHWDDSLTYKVNLAIEEAFSNIVFYAGRERMNVELNAQIKEDSLSIELLDKGIAFDPTQVDKQPHSESSIDRDVGGLGVLLIKKLSNKVQYCRKENMNCLKIYFDV